MWWRCPIALSDGLNTTLGHLKTAMAKPHKAKEKKLRYALSNSFGFGGTNASLIVKAFEG